MCSNALINTTKSIYFVFLVHRIYDWCLYNLIKKIDPPLASMHPSVFYSDKVRACEEGVTKDIFYFEEEVAKVIYKFEEEITKVIFKP